MGIKSRFTDLEESLGCKTPAEMLQMAIPCSSQAGGLLSSARQPGDEQGITSVLRRGVKAKTEVG